MFDNFEDIESDIENINTEMKEYTQEENDLQDKISNINNALNTLEGDSEIQEKVSEKKENRQSELEQVHNKKEIVSSRIENLIQSLEAQREENHNSANTLSSLENIGESVSEGKRIIQEREDFINESIKKLLEIDERSGDLFELADKHIDEIFNEEKTPFQKKREEFKNSLKYEIKDTPILNNEENKKQSSDVYKEPRERELYHEKSSIYSDSVNKLLNKIPDFKAVKKDYEEDVKIVNSILSTTTNKNIRSLSFTQQSWHIDNDGNEIFNSPDETGKKLDWKQGKYVDKKSCKTITGTCGIVSCVNIARLAGDNKAKEIDYVPKALQQNYCRESGGTNCLGRKKILAANGIDSYIESCDVDSIASRVSEGRGVIISVDASQLWKGIPDPEAGHAVVVTSVKRDSFGNVLGFYICDSGRHQSGSTYYKKDVLQASLTGRPMNVTSNIIR